VIERVILGDSGVLTMKDVVVHGFVFKNYGFYLNDYAADRVTYSFYNCSYNSIVQRSGNPAIYRAFGWVKGAIVNNSFINITQMTAGGMGAVLDHGFDYTMNVSDLYFQDIVGMCAASRWNHVGNHIGDNFVYNWVFRNISTTGYNGGAVHIDSDWDLTVVLKDSLFIDCRTSGAFGGLLDQFI
jgi:hypothetical protein